MPGLVGTTIKSQLLPLLSKMGYGKEPAKCAQGVAVIRIADDPQPSNAAAESASTEKAVAAPRSCWPAKFAERVQLVPGAACTPWVGVIPQPQVRHGKRRPASRSKISLIANTSNSTYAVVAPASPPNKPRNS